MNFESPYSTLISFFSSIILAFLLSSKVSSVLCFRTLFQFPFQKSHYLLILVVFVVDNLYFYGIIVYF